jgi:DNA-binding response OmpR family regulator
VNLGTWSQQTLSILIVEDSRSASTIMKRVMIMAFPNAIVYSANDGAVGLDLFRKHEPDIVVTDILMPEMDGIEMISKIRSMGSNVDIIAFTACCDGDCLHELKDLGIDVCLSKPFSLELLVSEIATCLERRHPLL